MAEELKNPDRHEKPGVLGRPDPELREEAKQILAEHGWTMNHFIVASLVVLTKNKDPKKFLDWLAEFRPAEKKGRPKKPRR